MSAKLKACIFGGALGDALGAPIEAMKNLDDIRKAYGADGITDFDYYKSAWNNDDHSEGIGAITDDTLMTACTLAASVMAKEAANGNEQDFRRLFPFHAWQTYLHWGARQKLGELISPYINKEIALIDEAKPFLFGCGIGLNTVAALSQGRMGTLDAPLTYDMEIDGRKLVGPNKGCGGIMRAAPVPFLATDAMDAFHLARENAAITHGDEDAQTATAVIAYLIRKCMDTGSIAKALDHTKQGTEKCWTNAIAKAWHAACGTKHYDPLYMDALPAKLGYESAFLAVPVFAQIIYALHTAQEPHGNEGDAFKQILICAVNHSGDSDSVGAVVGNAVGAAWGEGALPQDWMDKLQHRDDLDRLCNRFLKA